MAVSLEEGERTCTEARRLSADRCSDWSDAPMSQETAGVTRSQKNKEESSEKLRGA